MPYSKFQSQAFEAGEKLQILYTTRLLHGFMKTCLKEVISW